MEQLKCVLAFHAWCYYTKNSPLISDEQYDAWYRALEDLETTKPDKSSPTQNVGQGITRAHLKVCKRCNVNRWEHTLKEALCQHLEKEKEKEQANS